MEDILNLSQMRNGCFALMFEIFDPYESINFVRQIFLPKANAKEISLQVDTGEG